MERETKEFKTKSGKNTLILHTYITGRENRAIDSKLISSMKVDINDGAPSMKDINTAMLYGAEDEMIKAVVININGQVEGIVDIILNLPHDEYAEIIEELQNITKKKS